jgi:hypothetical protein
MPLDDDSEWDGIGAGGQASGLAKATAADKVRDRKPAKGCCIDAGLT